MGQELRVAGWLRFGNQAQLAKGLRAFAANAAPGFYDENSWDVVGLDASIRIETELPGDFTDVERPFMAMVFAAAAGYIDYAEAGKKSFFGGRNGPIARWLVHRVDRRLKLMWPEGHASIEYPGIRNTMPVQLTGKLTFGSPRARDQALGESGFRIPFLTRRRIDEVRLGRDAFACSGASLSAALSIDVDARVLGEPVIEVARALAKTAKSGSLQVTVGDRVTTIEPKAKLVAGAKRKQAANGKLVDIAAVAAKLPLPAAPAPKPAGRAAPAGNRATLLEAAAPTKGAKLLSTGHLVTWSDGTLSFWDLPQSTPVWSVKLGSPHDPDFAWPISGVTEIGPNVVAVFHDSDGTIDLVDVLRRERRTVELHGHTVYGIHRLADRCLSWSLDSTARSFTPSGELLATLETGVDGAVQDVHVMTNGTVLVRADDRLFSYQLETGRRIAELGKCEALCSLPGGRALLALDGRHELRDAAGIFATFAIEPDYSAHVVAAGDDRYLLHYYHSRTFHELRRTSAGWTAREIDSQHTKNLGAVVPLSDGTFLSHARSMPGLDERFGFDGNVRLWSADLEPTAALDMRAPIDHVVALPGARAAVVMRDAVRGKELAIVDATKRALASTLRGPKKAIAGTLWIPDHGLLVWSADRTTRLFAP